jgi:hypothetical protein
VRAAELAAARAEQVALAPWRAVIAAARLAKREALAARRAARIGKHDKDPMPVERLPGAGLTARAAGIAAATGAGGAGTAARIGKHDKDPMPMERLPGAGLGARAAGIAAATEAGGAGTAARMGKHDKDPMPMERLPGTGLGARAAGIAAATEAGGAGTAAGVASARQVSGPGDGRTVEVGRAAPVAKPHAPVGARPPRDAGLPEPHAPIPGLAVPATPPALPNRAARRRWKSLQRRKHRPFQHPSAPPVAARGWPDQPPGQAPGGKVYRP